MNFGSNQHNRKNFKQFLKNNIKSKRQFGCQLTNKQISSFQQKNKNLKKTIQKKMIKHKKPKQATILQIDIMDIQQDIPILLILKDQSQDPQLVSSHSLQILNYIKQFDYQMNPNYINNQKEINEKMRVILIDWLVQVAFKFKFMDETIQITIKILDKFLHQNKIEKKNFQLLGITCLFISAKYQQIYPPSLKNYIDVTDKIYQVKELLQMQGLILAKISFNLTFPYTSIFMNRYLKAIKASNKQMMFCKYLLQLSMLYIKFIKFKTNILACGIIYTARQLFNQQIWPNILIELSKTNKQDVAKCSHEILQMFQQSNLLQYNSIKNKYSSQHREYVSTIFIV